MPLEFTIRPVCEKDAEDIWEMRRLPGAFENMMGLPSDRLEGMRQFVAGLERNQHQLVAVVATPEGGERVIGLAGITVQQAPRARHVGDLGIVVHPQYHGMGVGTALLRELLELADNWLMLVRIELTVYTFNPAAKRLYERLGFELEGIQRKAAIRAGVYADLYAMARLHPNHR